ncbi:hypothetical protein WA026_010533 [Henosepilachna vigintioctopunctata]
MVPEGGIVKLTCRAKGHPIPHIQWRREDGNEIILREPSGLKTRVASYQGEVLRLAKISRSEMGAYMCIATNGVPPTVSKRITVNVHFHPVIHVPNQLVGSPLGTDVPLECHVEAFPKSINYWIRDTGEMVVNSYKYDVQTIGKSQFEVKMTVIVRNLQKEDAGSYRCIAKNSLGEVESNIRLYDIPGPTRTYIPLDEEDYNEQLGSAERDQDEELSNSVLERGHLPTLTTSGAPRGSYDNTHENHVPNDPAPNGSAAPFPRLFLLLLLLFRI